MYTFRGLVPTVRGNFYQQYEKKAWGNKIIIDKGRLIIIRPAKLFLCNCTVISPLRLSTISKQGYMLCLLPGNVQKEDRGGNSFFGLAQYALQTVGGRGIEDICRQILDKSSIQSPCCVARGGRRELVCRWFGMRSSTAACLHVLSCPLSSTSFLVSCFVPISRNS